MAGIPKDAGNIIEGVISHFPLSLSDINIWFLGVRGLFGLAFLRYVDDFSKHFGFRYGDGSGGNEFSDEGSFHSFYYLRGTKSDFHNFSKSLV